MARKPTLIFLTLTALVLGACSNKSETSSRPVTIEPIAPLPQAAIDEEVLSRISSLDQVALADNSCGLYLWTRIGTQRVLVTVLQNDQPGALMKLDGQTQRLAQTLTEGRAYYGLFEKTYLRGRDLEAELTLNHPSIAPLPQGATVKRASLRMTDATGFTLSLPLAGLIACKVPEVLVSQPD